MGVQIAPTVVVDGETITPEGWMWVLSFALAGVQWAIDECDRPEFDLRGKIRDYNRRREIYEITLEIKMIEERLESIRSQLNRI